MDDSPHSLPQTIEPHSIGETEYGVGDYGEQDPATFFPSNVMSVHSVCVRVGRCARNPRVTSVECLHGTDWDGTTMHWRKWRM